MTSEILEKHGLTPIEWDVLIGPHYTHFGPLNGLALYTVGEMALVRAFNPERIVATADTYREALYGLIEKGWLTVVTEEPETRAARLVARGIQVRPVDFLADVGCVDFTSQGYRRYRRLLKERVPCLQKRWSGQMKRRAPSPVLRERSAPARHG